MITKLRRWNRQKNQFLRNIKLMLACLLLDRNNNKPFQVENIKKVLVLRDDNKIGDMIISSGLFAHLNVKGIQVDVVAGENNQFLIKNSPLVKNVFIYKNHLSDILRLALTLRKEKYDVLLDFGDYTSAMYYTFVSLINAKHTLGFNKSNFKRYNININYPFLDKHITERYKLALEKFNIFVKDYNYSIVIPDDIEQETCAFLATLPGEKTIVLNPFAAEQERDLSLEQIQGIIAKIVSLNISVNIILLDPFSRLANWALASNVIKNPFPSFFSAAVFVQHADLVISPDTAWVHMACAYNKPLIALYHNKTLYGGFVNSKTWAPNYPLATQIITQEKRVSAIPVQQINAAIEGYLAAFVGNK